VPTGGRCKLWGALGILPTTLAHKRRVVGARLRLARRRNALPRLQREDAPEPLAAPAPARPSGAVGLDQPPLWAGARLSWLGGPGPSCHGAWHRERRCRMACSWKALGSGVQDMPMRRGGGTCCWMGGRRGRQTREQRWGWPGGDAPDPPLCPTLAGHSALGREVVASGQQKEHGQGPCGRGEGGGGAGKASSLAQGQSGGQGQRHHGSRESGRRPGGGEEVGGEGGEGGGGGDERRRVGGAAAAAAGAARAWPWRSAA